MGLIVREEGRVFSRVGSILRLEEGYGFEMVFQQGRVRTTGMGFHMDFDVMMGLHRHQRWS